MKHVPRLSPEALATLPSGGKSNAEHQQREVVLASIRIVVKSIEAIREAVAFNGVALANGAIDPQSAIRLVEEIAPGMLPPELHVICIANGWEILS